MDFKKLNKILESYITEVSDELVNSAATKAFKGSVKADKEGRKDDADRFSKKYKGIAHQRGLRRIRQGKSDMLNDILHKDSKHLKNESKINEISDETVEKVSKARQKEFDIADKAFDRNVRRAWKDTEKLDTEARKSAIIKKTDKASDRLDQARTKLANNKMLNKLRNKRKEQPKNESLYNVNGLGTINDKEYTDRVDVSFEISLGDYGIVRNPKTDEVIYGSAANDEGGYGAFDTTYISLEDVREVLEDIEDGFFDYIDSNRETELNNLDNNNLASIIYSINSYGDYFNMGVYEVDNTAEPILYLESKKVSKMESKINEGNYDNKEEVFKELERISKAIENEEGISYGELFFLENHHAEIREMGDIVLAQWAGIPEESWNESLVKTYKVTLKSDGGNVNVTTTASSKEQAIKQVCDIELAPESAVISVKELKNAPKMESKINEGNYDTDNAWFAFCNYVKRYADGEGVSIEDAIYQELDDLVYTSDIINIWKDMPGNLGSRITEITELMRQDIEEGAFEDVDFISNLTESKKSRRVGRKINEKMSVKKAKELYKQQGFLDSEDDKEAIEVLKNANYTIKINSRGTASVIELDRMREAFKDEMSMLTDINDLDFPQALADTVETTEDGEVLTLGKISDQIADIKSDVVNAIQDVKNDVKVELNDIKQDLQGDKIDSLDTEVEEIKAEIEEPTLPNEEIEPISPKEKPIEEPEDESSEEELEESLISKYLRKGKYEDLNKTKQQIDKMASQKKSAGEIKDTITIMSDDEKEEDEAEKYAIDKLKESLLSTSRTSKLSGLRK